MASTIYEFEALFDVPPSAFSPAPKVQSTFIKMSLKDEPFYADSNFEDLVRIAFSQRRKTISNTLKSYNINFEKLGLNKTVRPQDLSLEDYIHLYENIF